MHIAIDYDGTWTAAPELFKEFVELLKKHGFIPIVLTARHDRHMFSEPGRHWGDEVRANVGDIPIVFAGSRWKIDAAKEEGFDVKIFIDDQPERVAPNDTYVDALKQANHLLHQALKEIMTKEKLNRQVGWGYDSQSLAIAETALHKEELIYQGRNKNAHCTEDGREEANSSS